MSYIVKTLNYGEKHWNLPLSHLKASPEFNQRSNTKICLFKSGQFWCQYTQRVREGVIEVTIATWVKNDEGVN
jgi:hypothetical protein